MSNIDESLRRLGIDPTTVDPFILDQLRGADAGAATEDRGPVCHHRRVRDRLRAITATLPVADANGHYDGDTSFRIDEPPPAA